MALPEDFSKIYGSTATGGLTPINDVNYAKGWEFVGSNPPTKNDFSYLQNLSDRKSQWLYSNKLQRTDPFGDIKSDGTVKTALANLDLGDTSGYVGRKIAEQWITSSKTVTLNPLTKRIKVTLTGGGGGGGGAYNGGDPNNNFSGAGGAAGATGIKWFNVADITNWLLVIGSGGTEATKGGNSTFSGMVATGGNPSTAYTVYASGGVGVAGTGADINLPGGDGGDGQSGAYLLSGFGGASYWGGCRRAGQGQPGSTTITQAVIPGGGGGGAFDTQKMSTRFYGGQGGNGCCLIEEYA